MSAEQIVINYVSTPEPASPDVWVNLEQQAIQRSERNATLADMVQMFNRVISGESARAYQLEKCSAATIKSDGTIVVTIQVYVWPSSMALPYNLTPSYGSVTAVEVVSLEREVDLAIDGGSSASLPWLMESPKAWWQMDCINEFCEVVSNPTISVNGATVSLSSSCYGVLRVRGQVIGYKHTLELAFPKQGSPAMGMPIESTVDNIAAQATLLGLVVPNSITNIKVSVTVTYKNAEGEAQSEILSLDIPECVKDLLEYCEDGQLIHQGTETVTIGDTETPTPVVYYDTCTGNVIALRYE